MREKDALQGVKWSIVSGLEKKKKKKSKDQSTGGRTGNAAECLPKL